MNSKKLLLGFAALAGAFAATAKPGDVELIAGDYKVVIGEEPAKWSIVQIFYQGKEIGTRTGHYSNVLCPGRGKYIGAGHTEGGLEKPLSHKLSVDGRPVKVTAGQHTGKELVFSRESMLDKLKVTVSITLTPDGLKLSKKFTATAEQPVHQFYLFQFCFTNKSSDYLLERRNGSWGQGKFSSNRKFPVYGEKQAFAVCQYVPKFGLGHIVFMTEFGKVSGLNMLWDQTRYHKYYFWIDLPKVLPAGYVSPEVTMVVRAFPVKDAAEWPQAAKSAIAKLKAQYPLLPPPIEDDAGMTLQPSDKFQAHKHPIAVKPGAEYGVEFEIRKTPKMSAKPTDHYVMIGYYNAKKQLKTLFTAAANVKADGEFHVVKGAFKVPEDAANVNFYFYNSRSTGTVTVRRLKVTSQTVRTK